MRQDWGRPKATSDGSARWQRNNGKATSNSNARLQRNDRRQRNVQQQRWTATPTAIIDGDVMSIMSSTAHVMTSSSCGRARRFVVLLTYRTTMSCAYLCWMLNGYSFVISVSAVMRANQELKLFLCLVLFGMVLFWSVQFDRVWPMSCFVMERYSNNHQRLRCNCCGERSCWSYIFHPWHCM